MKINVLDCGYVRSVEAWGTGDAGLAEWVANHDNVAEKMTPEDYECGIVEAARQSTQGSFRGWDKDGPMISHLFNARPQHATPFEFAGLIIEVQAPIMVFREWHRHRTQSYNEMSARYAQLPELYYEPDIETTIKRAIDAKTSTNKQQQSLPSDAPVIEADVETWLRRGAKLQEQLEEFYTVGLKIGIPKELARYNMPVSHYSRMRACTCLRNWLAFLTLRDEHGVMWETRQYAIAVRQICESVFPRTLKLFDERRVQEWSIQQTSK